MTAETPASGGPETPGEPQAPGEPQTTPEPPATPEPQARGDPQPTPEPQGGGDPQPTREPQGGGDPQPTREPQGGGDRQPSGWRWWPPEWPVAVAVAAVVSVAAFVAGMLIGVYVIGSSDTSSSNNALACSYFWQFEGAPNIPTLVQLAMKSNPGTDAGSHFLGRWLYTLEQQVNSAQTAQALQNDSKDGTAMGISSICQQLGYNPPVPQSGFVI